MKYNFYKLNPRHRNGRVYKGTKPPQIVASLDIPEDMEYWDFMNKNYYSNLVYDDNFMKDIELNKHYYVISEDKKHFGVFSAYKGFSFWDCAEHDDRIVIAVELGLSKEEAHIL
jgi:hypothetical protein